jgi:acyl-homoserine-lactone acylase
MSLSYREDKDNRYVATDGETFIAVTEFGKAVQSKVLLSYGNASQPQSKHKMDQLQLLSQKKLRTALLSKKEILNNLERKESLKIPF